MTFPSRHLLPFAALVLVLTSVGILLAQAPGTKIPAAIEAAAVPTDLPTKYRPGPPTPRVRTNEKDVQGNGVTASCVTCHSTAKPNPQTRSAADLQQFHQGLKIQHGRLSCLSCHNDRDYNTLRLADGAPVAFPDVMTLCAQCHGQKWRDYTHGAHGGMNGFWDQTRGERLRNNCVNCHDAHVPAQPQVLPVLPPRDRISVMPKSSPEH